jgi:hypothetical protein
MRKTTPPNTALPKAAKSAAFGNACPLGHILNTTEVPMSVDVSKYGVDNWLPSALVIHRPRVLVVTSPVATSDVYAVGHPQAIGLRATGDLCLHRRRTMGALDMVEVENSAVVCKVSFHA